MVSPYFLWFFFLWKFLERKVTRWSVFLSSKTQIRNLYHCPACDVSFVPGPRESSRTTLTPKDFLRCRFDLEFYIHSFTSLSPSFHKTLFPCLHILLCHISSRCLQRRIMSYRFCIFSSSPSLTVTSTLPSFPTLVFLETHKIPWTVIHFFWYLSVFPKFVFHRFSLKSERSIELKLTWWTINSKDESFVNLQTLKYWLSGIVLYCTDIHSQVYMGVRVGVLIWHTTRSQSGPGSPGSVGSQVPEVPYVGSRGNGDRRHVQSWRVTVWREMVFGPNSSRESGEC